MKDISADGKIVLDNTRILKERAYASLEQIDLSIDYLISRICAQQAELSFGDVYQHACALIHSPSYLNKVHICKLLCEKVHFAIQLANTLSPDSLDDADISALGKIAYVRNKRNDDAFLTISKKLRGAKAMYVGSFSESCEAVFDNKSEYCLIPVENGSDGKLYSFYSMLDKYELKICRTVSFSGDDDSQNMTIALVGKSLPPLSKIPSACRLEFSVIRERLDSIGSIVGAAEQLGAHVSALGTQPLPYDNLKQRCYFAFDFYNVSPLPMIMFMLLEYPRSSLIGIYKIKEI